MNSVRLSDGAAAPPTPEHIAARSAIADPVVGIHAPDAIPVSVLHDWAVLGRHASEPNSFAEPWFVLPGIRHLADQQAIRILTVHEAAGGALVGLLPLVIDRRYGRMRVRHVRNWSHHHSFLATPLIRPGRERAFFTALLAQLDRCRWAAGFLHLDAIVAGGAVHDGLVTAAADTGRKIVVVHHHRRAELRAGLTPEAYAEQAIRKKKRKELKRLAARLADLGDLRFERWGAHEPVAPWCEAFLALERSGWKGRSGSALACDDRTRAFFRDVIEGAATAGRLQMIRLTLDGRPLAMLVNFLAPPGSFSFKIAIDEAFGRYSPGVLVELENLKLLADPTFGWMDSCAIQDHPMIDSLWMDRRTIIRVTVPLSGLRRRLIFLGCRTLEQASALRRRWLA